jgi:hypothetical protein
MSVGKRSSRASAHAGAGVEPVARLRPTAGSDRVLPTRVAKVQCARILAAAMGVATELGYGAMSTARVSARAGVSRKTFYELFADREDWDCRAYKRLNAVNTSFLSTTSTRSGLAGWGRINHAPGGARSGRHHRAE